MRTSNFFRLSRTLFASVAAMAVLHCGDASNGAPPGVDAVSRDSNASYVQLKDLTFKEMVPGVLWMAPVFGDPTAGPHDSVIRFAAGKALPPHYYTNAQNGMVLEGSLEQPTPSNQANVVTMGSGTFFHFPAKAEHSSVCARGADCVFLIHQDGPFDFIPVTEPIAETKVPQNPDAKFVPPGSLVFDSVIPGAVEMATLLGDRATASHSTVIRLAAGATLPSHYYTNEMRGVVLAGPMQQPAPFNEATPADLVLGSLFKFPGKLPHGTHCNSTTGCLFYVHQSGPFDFVTK